MINKTQRHSMQQSQSVRNNNADSLSGADSYQRTAKPLTPSPISNYEHISQPERIQGESQVIESSTLSKWLEDVTKSGNPISDHIYNNALDFAKKNKREKPESWYFVRNLYKMQRISRPNGDYRRNFDACQVSILDILKKALDLAMEMVSSKNPGESRSIAEEQVIENCRPRIR